jgi:hypothetical protein
MKNEKVIPDEQNEKSGANSNPVNAYSKIKRKRRGFKIDTTNAATETTKARSDDTLAKEETNVS